MKTSRVLSVIFSCICFSHINTANAVAVFYANEAAFNAATSGLALSLEGFEAAFAIAPTVKFPSLSITTNNASDLESLASGEGGGPDSTDGSRLALYSTLTPSAGGGGITITFDSPISAFSIDVIDPLDGAVADAYISLTNSNGDSQIFLVGAQGNNNIYFFGVVDLTQTFSAVTLFSTKPQDGIFIDRIQYSVVPTPPALWLFGSGLLGLVSLAKRIHA